MKKIMNPLIIGILIISGILSPLNCHGQSKNALIRNYLTRLPQGEVKDEGTLQKYRMTAVYTNRDLYGNFTGKTKVIGDYTSGFKNGFVSWNNVYISSSNKLTEPFPGGIKQEYMEDFKYFPSKQMLEEDAFKKSSIKVEWMDYSGYREYPQLYPFFEHGVSIMDLIFNVGSKHSSYMKFSS